LAELEPQMNANDREYFFPTSILAKSFHLLFDKTIDNKTMKSFFSAF